jgi:acyl carrier protein
MMEYRHVITQEAVREQVLALMTQLAGDWEYDGEITMRTYLFSELGFQSLDAVVLGNTLQERYGRPIPYADLLADIGRRTFNDVTVGEWIDFTYQHVAQTNGASDGA